MHESLNTEHSHDSLTVKGNGQISHYLYIIHCRFVDHRLVHTSKSTYALYIIVWIWTSAWHVHDPHPVVHFAHQYPVLEIGNHALCLAPDVPIFFLNVHPYIIYQQIWSTANCQFGAIVVVDGRRGLVGAGFENHLSLRVHQCVNDLNGWAGAYAVGGGCHLAEINHPCFL